MITAVEFLLTSYDSIDAKTQLWLIIIRETSKIKGYGWEEQEKKIKDIAMIYIFSLKF